MSRKNDDNEPKETEYDFYEEPDEDGWDEEPPVTL